MIQNLPLSICSPNGWDRLCPTDSCRDERGRAVCPATPSKQARERENLGKIRLTKIEIRMASAQPRGKCDTPNIWRPKFKPLNTRDQRGQIRIWTLYQRREGPWKGLLCKRLQWRVETYFSLPRERRSLKRSFLWTGVQQWSVGVVLRRTEVWKTRWQSKRSSSQGLVASPYWIFSVRLDAFQPFSTSPHSNSCFSTPCHEKDTDTSKCIKKIPTHLAWPAYLQVMSALALQESRERRETKLQVEIESGQFSYQERARDIWTLVSSLWDLNTWSFLDRVSEIWTLVPS